MNKIKNSFLLGILLGLAISSVLLVIVHAVTYFIHLYSGTKILEIDVIFAICILGCLASARVFYRKEAQQELGKGFLFSSFIWGAAYVFLFHISPIKSLFFLT